MELTDKTQCKTKWFELTCYICGSNRVSMASERTGNHYCRYHYEKIIDGKEQDLPWHLHRTVNWILRYEGHILFYFGHSCWRGSYELLQLWFLNLKIVLIMYWVMANIKGYPDTNPKVRRKKKKLHIGHGALVPWKLRTVQVVIWAWNIIEILPKAVTIGVMVNE